MAAASLRRAEGSQPGDVPGDALTPLPRSFYRRSTVDLAAALLGQLIVRTWEDGTFATGAIVETEAYGGPDDRASHARSGPTRRNRVMFGPPGHAYLYRVYGLHTCLNVVGAADGEIGAVLVRAVLPIAGAERLQANRRRPGRSDPRCERVAAGPGNVGAAFDLGLGLDGHDLTEPGELWLAAGVVAGAVVVGPRIGVAYAGLPGSLRPWRFGIDRSPALSRPFPAGA